MKKLVFALILLFIATPSFAWVGTVVKISDGDTLWVETETQATKIRLLGLACYRPYVLLNNDLYSDKIFK